MADEIFETEDIYTLTDEDGNELNFKLLAEADKPKTVTSFEGEEYVYGHTCKNRRCITTSEQELPKIFKITDKNAKIARCIYCESKISY